ncbi:vomeronasal type-2 receptor 26-like [Engystomops pustulosus]|uniref:vomeronasal type-2 receptor 26-like n=1 Tax=Engystomops pustulosus TaxID=76066 RepID=UPI003AFA0723
MAINTAGIYSANCIRCPSDEWPNEKRDRCQPKVIEFISYQTDTIASSFSFLSVLGCVATGLIFGTFIMYRDSPIVKANNRNLSYLLLVSIFLSFLSVFLFLGRPSDITCRLRETTFGILFSIAVSSLLAKTVMVCVAFKSTKPGSSWRKMMGMKLSYSIVILGSSIQVAICVVWLSVSPPFQDLDTQSYQGRIIIRCNEGSIIGFYSVLGYLGLLASVSFVLAFMVRTLPDSFNEAKYITFSMLLFCSVWIAMIPAFLSTRGKYTVAVEIFAVLASSAGLLGCVFFPKCYIIFLRSEMNTKTSLLVFSRFTCKNITEFNPKLLDEKSQGNMGTVGILNLKKLKSKDRKNGSEERLTGLLPNGFEVLHQVLYSRDIRESEKQNSSKICLGMKGVTGLYRNPEVASANQCYYCKVVDIPFVDLMLISDSTNVSIKCILKKDYRIANYYDLTQFNFQAGELRE